MIDITGLDRAQVLKALYDASHIQGMGFLQAVPEGTVTVEHCRELLDSGEYYFDYLYGRVMKVNLSGNTFDERLYDRDNGTGAAQRAIDKLTNGNSQGYITIARDCGIDINQNIFSPAQETIIRFRSLAAVEAMIHLCMKVKNEMEGN